jgi:hypothetical protein
MLFVFNGANRMVQVRVKRLTHGPDRLQAAALQDIKQSLVNQFHTLVELLWDTRVAML